MVVTNHVYGDQGQRAFFRCGECDVIYLYPPLSTEQEAEFYAREFTAFMADRTDAGGEWDAPDRHVAVNEQQRLRRMQYLETVLGPTSERILEVGCSSGFMLYPLAERGYPCFGIEPSSVFRDYVHGRGLNCFDSMDDLEKHSVARDGFDLIMHFFVLEHISEAIPFLKRQLDLLRPGGRLVVEVPNASDALWTVYDVSAFERFYWSVAHSWYFTQRSLGFLLERLNRPYKILLDQRYDLSNHMIWARDGRPGGMGRFTTIIGPEIERQYREALIRAGRCDTLVAIVRAST